MHHLRFMATTAESPAGRAALAYLRAVIRIAPVRLVNLSGALDARWEPMENLIFTPMDTPMLASIVCTDPERWAYRLSIPMPKKDPFAAALARGSADGKAIVVPTVDLQAEKAERLVELYTAGTRNVLIATSVPPSKVHCTAAARYEAVIVPSEDLADKFEGAIGRRPLVIPYPVVEHGALRAAIIS